MIKTTRSIRSSLDVARKQRAPSFTQKIEEKMKAELEKEFGPIVLGEKGHKVIEKEKMTRAKQNLALKKSMRKILEVKERAKALQSARQGPIQINLSKSKKKTKKMEDRSKFKKIDIGY